MLLDHLQLLPLFTEIKSDHSVIPITLDDGLFPKMRLESNLTDSDIESLSKNNQSKIESMITPESPNLMRIVKFAH